MPDPGIGSLLLIHAQRICQRETIELSTNRTMNSSPFSNESLSHPPCKE
jgi:hypothetical protein